MTRHKNGIKDSVEDLMEDAHALLAATADVAGEKVANARKRVAATLEVAKDAYAGAQKAAVAGAKATDEAIRERPYHAMGIALGVGVALGVWLSRRRG